MTAVALVSFTICSTPTKVPVMMFVWEPVPLMESTAWSNCDWSDVMAWWMTVESTRTVSLVTVSWVTISRTNLAFPLNPTMAVLS